MPAWKPPSPKSAVGIITATRIRSSQICFASFSSAIAAFCQDMGDRMEDIVLVTMSEFGRTVEENGDAGTDHGHGGLMMVLGGAVRGGKIYGEWPGLEKEQLYEGRDLAVTTDFRTVLSELVRGHLGRTDLSSVFPGFNAKRELGLLRVWRRLGAVGEMAHQAVFA